MWRWPWSAPAAREVVLYTREGCHLCQDVLDLLSREQTSSGFSLEVIDVDSDPELTERHGLEVPVVTVDGKVRFRGQVNPVLLRRTLRGG